METIYLLLFSASVGGIVYLAWRTFKILIELENDSKNTGENHHAERENGEPQ